MRSRQRHTGGGDGDEYKLSKLEEDAGLITLDDDEVNDDENSNKGKTKGTGMRYSQNQLDLFEQSEIYKMFDEV